MRLIQTTTQVTLGYGYGPKVEVIAANCVGVVVDGRIYFDPQGVTLPNEGIIPIYDEELLNTDLKNCFRDVDLGVKIAAVRS